MLKPAQRLYRTEASQTLNYNKHSSQTSARKQFRVYLIAYRIKMIQQQFAQKVTAIVKHNPTVIGLAVAGSWLTNEVDEFSDLDLILVTNEKVGGDKDKMMAYAQQFGALLSGFTGEHVGEPRLLICLYDEPLLHVDIKFLTPDEFGRGRVETPFVLHDTGGQLQQIIDTTEARFPYPDYQWIEDRFWIWVHYALLKIGRGEYMEAMDFLGFMRMMVLGPLLHIKNGNLPRGVRKVEMQLPEADLQALKLTIAGHDKTALLAAIQNAVNLYQDLRSELYTDAVVRQVGTEERVVSYLQQRTDKK